MPRGYEFPQATSIDHPIRPSVRQQASKILPLVDHPGGGAAVSTAAGLPAAVPHLVDIPGNSSAASGPGPRDNVASVQATQERNYAQYRRDELTRIANCAGTISNGNCVAQPGGLYYDTPDGNWWNTPYNGIGNPGYDFAGGTTIGYTANSTWSTNGGQIVGAFSFTEDRDDNDVWNANWNNCNCGSNNCYTNCNCNCACACACGDCGTCP